ncbi:DUF998 domain-containing protein [Humidisolicoccus flavus]|uniref:DUF998 domain-containing protein n=1 Tax=Humidisolicoccus flavus TaxID=3111414 RepID=UPI0032534C12
MNSWNGVGDAAALKIATPNRFSASRAREQAVAVVSIVLLMAGCAVIMAARLQYVGSAYISEVGSAGVPTEHIFRDGFTLLVIGIALAGFSLRHERSSVSVFSRWSAGVTLWVAAAALGIASGVTCSMYCPTPFNPAFAIRDVIHISSAVIGFAGGCWAMLQLATSPRRSLRIASVVSAVLVAVISGTGGIMSLASWNTHIGGNLEFIAAGLAMLWLSGCLVAIHWGTRRAVAESAQ